MTSGRWAPVNLATRLVHRVGVIDAEMIGQLLVRRDVEDREVSASSWGDEASAISTADGLRRLDRDGLERFARGELEPADAEGQHEQEILGHAGARVAVRRQRDVDAALDHAASGW